MIHESSSPTQKISSTKEYFDSLKWLSSTVELKIEDRPEVQGYVVRDKGQNMALELPYLYLRCRNLSWLQRQNAKLG